MGFFLPVVPQMLCGKMCEFERQIFFFLLEKSSLPNTHSHQHFSIIVCPIGDLRHSTKPNPNLGFNQRTKHHFSHQIEQYTSRLTDRFRCKCNTFFGFVSIFAALHTGHQQSIDSRKCTISFFIRFFLFVFFCCEQRPRYRDILCKMSFICNPFLRFYSFF